MSKVKDFVQKEEKTKAGCEQKMPTINFSTFIMSLNASALVNFGILEDPVTGKKNASLPVGKQTIDILVMLKEKTSGNLSNDELKMLDSIIYELRMTYVKQKG